MSKQNIRQNALQKTWSRKEKPETFVNSDGFSSMRGWQIEAFNKLKDSPRMILNAPMGSGKSWIMCLLSAYKMTRDPTLRSIICVPQIVIAPGFVSAKILLPDGTKIDWQIKNNLCAKEETSSKVSALIHWLDTPSVDFQDRVILCSHATILRAYRKLQREGRLDLLDRLLIWIDEAHHLMNTSSEDFPTMIENNGIGKVIEYLLSQTGRNIQIGLTTATCFRGDRLGLLTQEMWKKFKPYLLPYDKYLASMEHLESFNFDFLICGHNYIRGIELLMQQRRGKDIIYIPHPNSPHSQGKQREVNNIINMYHNIHGGDRMRAENGIILLGTENKSFKIVDLVDDHPHKRSQGKSFVTNPTLKKERESLDAIIALNMFKEGADWIWADRCIIVGIRSSLVDIIQMVGRVLRDAKGKKHVEVIQLLPFSLDQTNASVFRENLNDYLKAIYASLILENIIDPVQIKPPSSSGRREEQIKDFKGAASTKTSDDWLSVVLPDAAEQHALLENISSRLMSIKSEKNEPMSLIEHQKILCDLLEKEGISEHKEEISWQILGMWTRKNMKLQGIAVEAIDFDIVQIGEPLEFLLTYTSGACNVDTFQKLRDAIQLSRSWRPFTEAREWIRALKLSSETQWRMYISKQMPHLLQLPDDIPRAPWVAYKGKGWESWGDFLGTNITAPRLRKYRPYEKAQAFAHSLKLKRKEDWFLYIKGNFQNLPTLPSDIAACPDKTYRRKDYGKKWIGWGDFLGTGSVSNQNKAKRYLTYEEAKAFAQPLKLNSSGDWRKYISGEMPRLPKFPQGMPKKPDQVYENFEWWEFLGAEISKMNSQRDFWPFQKSRDFVKNLGLKSFEDWIDYCADKFAHLPTKPLEIPSNPQKKYKDSGWQGYAHWMGY